MNGEGNEKKQVVSVFSLPALYLVIFFFYVLCLYFYVFFYIGGSVYREMSKTHDHSPNGDGHGIAVAIGEVALKRSMFF